MCVSNSKSSDTSRAWKLYYSIIISRNSLTHSITYLSLWKHTVRSSFLRVFIKWSGLLIVVWLVIYLRRTNFTVWFSRCIVCTNNLKGRWRLCVCPISSYSECRSSIRSFCVFYLDGQPTRSHKTLSQNLSISETLRSQFNLAYWSWRLEKLGDHIHFLNAIFALY